MSSFDGLDAILHAIRGAGSQNGSGNPQNSSGSGDNSKFSISPSQALVIAGILGGVLSVYSVLVNRSQGVEILLTGTLKQKTQMDKILDQMGSMKFDDVMKAVLGRLEE